MENKVVGDENGMILWELMSTTTDDAERDYFNRLLSTASKHGVVWFTDMITQRDSGKPEQIWQIKWNESKGGWKISPFYTPNGRTNTTKRIEDFKKKPAENPIEVDINDLIV